MNQSTPQAISIRRARPDEIIQILRVQTDALRILCAQDYSPEQIEYLIDRKIHYAGNGQNQAETTFVANSTDGIIGVSALLGHRVSAVYVHPQFARQGIGSRLLNVVERAAIARRISILGVTASLTAQPFYQSCGYQTIRTSYLKADHSLRIRCIEMEKQLLPD